MSKILISVLFLNKIQVPKTKLNILHIYQKDTIKVFPLVSNRVGLVFLCLHIAYPVGSWASWSLK